LDVFGAQSQIFITKYKEMFMKLKIAEETDHELWDTIADRSPNGTLSYTWKWLKLVEKHSVLRVAGLQSRARLYPLFIIENEKPAGIYPLFLYKTLLGSSWRSPPSDVNLMYLGPLLPDIDMMNQEKKQIFLQDMQVLVDRYIKKEIKSNYILINTPPGFDDCRLFKWSGYTVIPRYTYYIDLSQGLDQIWSGLGKNTKRNIERVKKEGVTVTDGSKEDALFIYNNLAERKRSTSSIDYLNDIFDQFFPDHIKIFIAKAGSERLSGIITTIHKDKVCIWVGAPKCSYKGQSPNELVIWESIRWASEQGYKIFELEGADDFTLYPFKRKFNGKLISFYQMRWRSPLLSFISSLYHPLKKENCALDK
jgi:lipid II:glycine glycyltransferase (peptidoglycan interpeptide bridge formation enzyme)